ncbi:hypothetical protein FGO68_gene1831 [Halteria grandinella]|uniref:Uncharacterized protein n=1 Tax=Halteria grandinella TaxID=5974 RepID=A0A8J8SVG6_HALGN|nr:hypothetical protein FGO68_gene1831 [Halteria grandinella]
MVEFSERITMSIPGAYDYSQMLQNLNLLSGYLLGSLYLHKFDEKFNKTKLNIETSSIIIIAILTSKPEMLCAYPPLVEYLSKGQLDNLVNLMNFTQGFREVEIQNV